MQAFKLFGLSSKNLQRLTNRATGDIMRLSKLVYVFVWLGLFATHAYGQGTIAWTSPLIGTSFPKPGKLVGSIEVKGTVDRQAGWSMVSVTAYTAHEGKKGLTTPLTFKKEGHWPLDSAGAWKENTISSGFAPGTEVEVWVEALMHKDATKDRVTIKAKKVAVKVK